MTLFDPFVQTEWFISNAEDAVSIGGDAYLLVFNLRCDECLTGELGKHLPQGLEWAARHQE